jgi:hypothetical protein
MITVRLNKAMPYILTAPECSDIDQKDFMTDEYEQNV